MKIRFSIPKLFLLLYSFAIISLLPASFLEASALEPDTNQHMPESVAASALKSDSAYQGTIINVPDGDVTTLINAIATGNTSETQVTINLAANGTYTLTQANNGTNGFPAITGSIKIVGSNTTIQRSTDPGIAAFRFFTVTSEGWLILDGVSLINGAPGAQDGGAVLNFGSLDIYRSTFSNNQANNGGAIANQSGSFFALNSNFLNNQAVSGNGGAILINAGVVGSEISVTNLNNNVAALNGGALYMTSIAITLDFANFDNNTAASGGGIYNNQGTITLTEGTFINNHTTTQNGGGIANYAGTVNGSMVQFLGNTAQALGGGIYNSNSAFSHVNVGGSCFVNNSSAIVNDYPEFPPTVIAENNWWGTWDGPNDDGIGIGDAIFGEIDYIPFSSSAVLNCPFVNARPNINLVTNGDFHNGETDWDFTPGVVRSIVDEQLHFHRPVSGTEATVEQYIPLSLKANSPLELKIDLQNASSGAKDVFFTVFSPNAIDSFSCYFTMPAGGNMRTYTLRAKTSTAWSNIFVDVYVFTADGLPSLILDNVNLQYKPALVIPDSLPEADCSTNGMMWVDYPADGQALLKDFNVQGWAVDPAPGNGSGPGVASIKIYQGTSCIGTPVVEATPTLARPDVASAFGLDSSYNLNGFNISLTNIPDGSYTFTTCAFSSFTGLVAGQITRTVTIQSSLAVMAVDSPAASTIVPPDFAITGWAVDSAAGNGGGTGVNLVRVYQGSACSGTTLGEAAQSIPRSDVVAAFGLDNSYNTNGFSILLSGLSNGSLTFTTCARSAVTNTFTAQVTRTVNVQSSQAVMFMDTPSQDAVLLDSFAVTGWAVDPAVGNGNGMGINLVRIYQGSACTGTILGEAAPAVARPDVAAAFGLDSSYNMNGFNVPLNNLSGGSLTFTACARSALTNTFMAQTTRTVTVHGVFMSVDVPAANAVINTTTMTVIGWAVRPAAGTGSGVGVNLVRVYQGSACTGTILGEAAPTVARPDVATAFALDATYNNSGFSIPISNLPDGSLTFTTCARSNATNTFDAQVTHSVTVQATFMSVDVPAANAVINTTTMTVAGWVLRLAGTGNGVGVNLVRVYQGSACTGTILGEAAPTVARPDVAAAFGLDATYNNSGFSIPISNLPDGSLTFTTCARSSATNTFTAQITRSVTVQATFISVDVPAANVVINTTTMTVAGWALRLAGTGSGVGVNLVRVYQGSACTGTILGEAAPTVARPDVAAAFTLDATYNNSGFIINLSGLANGALTFTTCARSSATNTFTAQITRSVTISSGFVAANSHLRIEAEDTTKVLQQGDWTVRNSLAASGGAYLYSSGQDTLSLNFEGTSLTIIYVQHPTLGHLAVEIDDVVQQTINLSGIENFGEQVLISDLSPGTHQLRLITVEGITAVDAVEAAP